MELQGIYAIDLTGTARWSALIPHVGPPRLRHHICGEPVHPPSKDGFGSASTWARKLAHLLLTASDPSQWEQLQQVVCRARRIGKALLEPDEQDVLEAAAWLHSIGYAPAVVSSGHHPLDAARYLRDHTTFPPRICGLVAHHCSAASEAVLRGLSDQLAEFPDERTLTRDVLWHCTATTFADDETHSFLHRQQRTAFGASHSAALAFAEEHRQVRSATRRVVEALT